MPSLLRFVLVFAFLLNLFVFPVQSQAQSVCDPTQISVPVLMYHRVSPKGKEATTFWETSYDQLEAQMRWFHENGYSAITTKELYDFIQTGKIENPKSFLPIFDDNWYESVKYRVLPVMSQYGFTATLALYTDHIYDKAEYGFTWDELRAWEEAGLVDVQSHSVSHPLTPALNQLPKSAIWRELKSSKSAIEENFDKEVLGFIAPGGSVSSDVVSLAQKAGYKVLYLLWEKGGVKSGDDPLWVYRVNMIRTLTFESFIAKMQKYSTPDCPTTSVPKTPHQSRPERIVVSDKPIFENCQIVAYYGSPTTGRMGILGEYAIEDLVNRQGGLDFGRPTLARIAAEYDGLNGDKCVIPAFHIVFGTVQPGGEIITLSEKRFLPYIEYAQKHGMIVILDHQLGKYPVADAVKAMLPYLKYSSVHLAIDPEWRTSRPAKEVGFVTGQEVNASQKLIQEYLEENGIPGRKMLVVHQFSDAMIHSRHRIEKFSRVDLVHDADGFGTPGLKIAQYKSNSYAENMALKGIKLFFPGVRQWGVDKPLMSPREVLELDPQPVLIIYQ